MEAPKGLMFNYIRTQQIIISDTPDYYHLRYLDQ